ncbi:zf-HC2 domain-containing protein [Streptomyces sp. NPDC049954]|uniref:zf-HC2 domain-containing protein n=1 Tax=Streptomyces sp. NPDC049954 TaxID=3155779 RepID=UPI0034425379
MNFSRHTDPQTAAHYARGALPEARCATLESHVESCGRCAAAVSRAVRETAAGQVLDSVRESVLLSVTGTGATTEAPATRARATAAQAPGVRTPGARAPLPRPRTAGERFGATARGRFAEAVRPGAGGARWPATLRALCTALSPGWWAAVLLVVAGTLVLGLGAGSGGARPLLLAVAPVLPLAGVALAYGPYADPLHELALAAPRGGLRLLLLRTAALSAVCLPLLTAVGALLPGVPGAPGPGAWLLPSLALTLTTLAAGSYVGCRAAAAGCAAGWAVAVALPTGRPGPSTAIQLAERLSLLLDGPAAQTGWALGAVLCAALLTLRRTAYDHI